MLRVHSFYVSYADSTTHEWETRERQTRKMRLQEVSTVSVRLELEGHAMPTTDALYD